MKLIKIEDLPGVLPAKHYDLLARRITGPSIGAKAMEVSLVRMEPKGRADSHTHDEAEQLFIVLRGEMGMKTAEGEARLKQGEAAFIYPGEVHENYNVAGVETEYIVITGRLSS
ncbi:cupin domain-containing protein [Chloroflexota bacterium]